MRLVIFGLAVSSSWGNGHATLWRGLIRALGSRGWSVTFFERDTPYYSATRDIGELDGGRLVLYPDWEAVRTAAERSIASADTVIVTSYCPDALAATDAALSAERPLSVFYDLDTPVTLAKLAAGDEEYLSTALLSAYDVYLSFTGGPTLRRLEAMGSPRAAALYCSVDPEVHAPVAVPRRWRLGYLGTFSPDRQPTLEALLVEPARALPDAAFVVAGPQYPDDISWPDNVERITHLPPSAHAAWYSAQDFTLNVTRADMRRAGWSPARSRTAGRS